MARVDPRAELKALDEAIARKTDEIAELEEVVVRNSMVPSDAERVALRLKLEEYHEILDNYSKALEARGLPKYPRPETTEQHISDLFAKSQATKHRRDQLLKDVAGLQDAVKKAEAEKRRKARRAAADYTRVKEFIEKVRAELKKLAEALPRFSTYGKIGPYCKKLKGHGDALHPELLNRLKAKIAEMMRERRSFRKKLQAQIDALEQENEAEIKRQGKTLRVQKSQQRKYEESVRLKKEAENECAREREKMDIIHKAITRNVTHGRVWYRQRVSVDTNSLDVLAKLKKKVDELVDKVVARGNLLDWTQYRLNERWSFLSFKFTVPGEYVTYKKLKDMCLKTATPREFLLMRGQPVGVLGERLNAAKEKYANDQKKYEEEREASRQALSDARSHYDKVMKRVQRAGLKPLETL